MTQAHLESPRLYSEGVFDFRLNTFPPSVRCYFEEQKRELELINGGMRVYHRGFKLISTLTWDRTLCTMAQYDLLRSIVNSKASFTFYPYPDTFSGSLFTVRIMSGMSLKEWQWVADGFKGSLELHSTVNIAAIPAWA